ncbi:MAG TPA: hypothetical protein PLI13_09570, partial [Paracoccus sp. (in: a-proteobacteria)]|nr:hypothetical protein [Paracoccus sp. (in: a-proteobacteria)]
AMAASLAAGHPVGAPELDTLADSLGGKLCGPVPLVQPSPGTMLDMPGEDCFHFASRDGLLHPLADLGETVTAPASRWRRSGRPTAAGWRRRRSRRSVTASLPRGISPGWCNRAIALP